jgi:hypothetical protein
MLKKLKELFSKPQGIAVVDFNEPELGIRITNDDGTESIIPVDKPSEHDVVVRLQAFPLIARISEAYMDELLQNPVYGIPTMEDHRGRLFPIPNQGE